MSRDRGPFRGLTFAISLSALLLTPSDARAEPPPPSFGRFLVTNSTGFDMAAIELKLYLSKTPARDEIDLQSPVVVHIPSLASGATFPYVPTQPTWGVALIQVTEARVMNGTPFGLRLSKTLQITAKKAAFGVDGAQRYAGFTNAGPTSTHQMAAAFGANDAHLRAKWRWGWNWPDGVWDRPPDNPQGDEIENWPNGPEEEKTTYVPAENPLPEWVTMPCCPK